MNQCIKLIKDVVKTLPMLPTPKKLMAPFLPITSPKNIGWRKRRHGGRLMATDDFVWIAQGTCFQLLWIRRIGSWLVEIRIGYSGHII